MLGVGVGFASFVAGWALRSGMATSLSRMGADLVVRTPDIGEYHVELTDSSTDGCVIGRRHGEISCRYLLGLRESAPQRIVPSMIDDHAANLIAFDPASDFSILPWLGEHQPAPLSRDSVITGGRVAARVGEAIQICGKSLVVHGRL